MEKLLKNTSGLLLVMILALFVSVPASAGTTGLISIDELKAMIDDPDLVILDVRTGRDWKSSEFKIKGAVRASSKNFDELGEKYGKDKKYVTYCA